MDAARATPSSDKPSSLLREELKRAWRELRGVDASPARTAAAVAIGLFVGCQPAFGTHTPIVLATCLWLQLDAALAWVAANISIPPIAAFLVPAEVQLGSYLHTGHALAFSWATFRQAGFAGTAKYAFTGSAVIGAALAAIGAAAVYVAVAMKRRFSPGAPRAPYRLPDAAPAFWHAVERVASRYVPGAISSPAERSRFHYVRVKMLMDPVSAMVLSALQQAGPGGELLDIGTGRGQLPIALVELGLAKSARGIDWDRAKVDAARAAAARQPALPVRFDAADARSAELGAADIVLLIDVLHYLAEAEQDALLDRAAAAVRPGGKLVVREADSERGWRSWMTFAEEALFTALRFNRGARVRLRSARAMTARLERAGLRCEIAPAWGRTPFSNVLIVASKTGE